MVDLDALRKQMMENEKVDISFSSQEPCSPNVDNNIDSTIEPEDKGEYIDLSKTNKIFDYQLSNIDNTLNLKHWLFTTRLSGIQKVIDSGNLSDYEADRLRLLQGWLCFVYFDKHFCDDNFDSYEQKYYEILDKVDEYVESMSNVTYEAAYLYNVANMYSVHRFRDIEPLDKLNELWKNLQNIELDGNETEFKVSFWEETAKEVYDLMKDGIVEDDEYDDNKDNFLDDYDHIKDKVIDIVSHTLNVKKSAIHTYTKLADLGADSLDAVDIIMEIEKEFDIIVSEESTSKINTVGDIITNIAKSQIIDEEDDNEDGYDEDEYDEEYDDDYESDDFLNDYDSIKNKVFEIVSDTLSVEKEVIHTYTKLSDLGADSLDTDLITEIENIFDIIVPDGSTSKINTVGDIITYITKHQYQ